MSVTASPTWITASCAAATNDRPGGNRRNSDVWDKNTRRGGSSLGIRRSTARKGGVIHDGAGSVK